VLARSVPLVVVEMPQYTSAEKLNTDTAARPIERDRARRPRKRSSSS
jgi:hypothetical protein